MRKSKNKLILNTIKVNSKIAKSSKKFISLFQETNGLLRSILFIHNYRYFLFFVGINIDKKDAPYKTVLEVGL